MIENIILTGLEKVVSEYKTNEIIAQLDHWKIKRASFDIQFQIFYDDIVVINCIKNKLINVALLNEDFIQVKNIVTSIYTNLE